MSKIGGAGVPGGLTRPATIGLAILLAVAVLALAAFIFQDNLVRFTLNPRTPFQTQTPGPAPNYGAAEGWRFKAAAAVQTDEEPRPAIFFVHSTAYYSPASWNAPVESESIARLVEQVLLPNEAGPFAALGDVFAPRYREATLFSFFTHKYDGVAARQFAYRDIERAFASFLAEIDDETPIMLVGYGQGGLHILRLLETRIAADAGLTARLAAAYVLGQPTPLYLFEKQLAPLKPCATRTDIRCVVSYVAFEPRFHEEIDRAQQRSMVWSSEGDLVATRGQNLLCTHPLTWVPGDGYQGPEKHRGAASATGIEFGSTPPAVTRAIGARCAGGVLIVDKPVQKFLRRSAWFGAKWKAADYNLFYFDLRANAEARLQKLAAVRYEEARVLEPIKESVDLGVSPINPVPKN